MAIGNPADGHYAIKAITNSGGWSEDVSDAEVVDSIQLLAETEGVFTETAGGVTVGCTRKLVRDGRISADETTVVFPLDGAVAAWHAIAPKLAEFERFLSNTLEIPETVEA